MDTDRYLAVATPASAEPPRTKGSRFIGDAFPAVSEDDVAMRVASVRRREHAATHWCWAARLGAPGESGDGSRPRYSDDGEPAGSAGLPILREIDRRGLTDTLVIVTRYYGGVKLGSGGLARAYGEAAGASLDVARVVERVVRETLRLRFDFDDTSAALRVARRFEADFGSPTYDESGVLLEVRVPRSRTEEMAAAFVDATAGRGRVVPADGYGRA